MQITYPPPLFDVKYLLNFINVNFDSINFSDAASFSGFSEGYFSRTFHSKIGVSFSQYLNIIKTKRAVDILTAPETKNSYSMAEVAIYSGFNTIRTFNRVFKRITGYSPKNLPKDYCFDYYNVMEKRFNNEFFNPTENPTVQIE